MKTTIATAVIAGFTLSQRLVELGVEDDQVRELVGTLGGSLGAIMDAVEKVDIATGLVQAAAQRDDLLTVVEGLAAIKGVTANLVSDQQTIMDAMYGGMSKDELAMLMLLQELAGIKL